MNEQIDPQAPLKSDAQTTKKSRSVLIVTLVLLLVAAIATYGVYYWQQQKINDLQKQINELKNKATVTTTTKPASTVVTAKTTTFTITNTVTSKSMGTASFVTPTGWTTVENTTQLQNTINATGYRIEFQGTEQDYLKGSYGGDATLIKTVSLKDGTPAYIIRTRDYVALSSCAPAKGYGCSFTLSGQPVLVLMHGYQKGDQYVRELTFGIASTNQAINDFESLTKSLVFSN